VDLQIRPAPTARVSGIASGPDGPATGLVIQLVPAAAGEVALASDGPATVSDRNGRFGFSAVPAGQYLMRASVTSHAVAGSTDRDGMLWAEAPVTVGAADVDGVALVLQQGLRISGSVHFDGAQSPPGGARSRVLIEPADAMPGLAIPPMPIAVNPNGQFISTGLPRGKYHVRLASAPPGWMVRRTTYNGADVTDTPLDLEIGDAEGVVLTLTDRVSGLRGVVSSRRGPPDPDAAVLVFPSDSQSWTNNGASERRVRSARTSATGQYGIPLLPPGEYYVAAIPDEHAIDWQDVAFLEALSGIATRVRIAEAQQRTHDLRTQELR
jgi:hypothetical protein